MSHPESNMIIQNFRVRNFTHEDIAREDLDCLVQFLSSLDVCKSCIAQIPQIQSSFGSDLNYSVDFKTKTLDIHYGKNLVSY
ncbi:MAG: hypothetical protein ACFE9L_12000 [Candidatus Hodarchaeota archaeon]